MKEEQISARCRLRVLLLGTLEVLRRDEAGTWQIVTKAEWGSKYGKAARRILARLLAAPGRRVSQGRLLDDLWPETDAKGNLDNGLTVLRHVIGRDLLTTLETFYHLADQTLIWMDVDACAALLQEAENQGHGTSTLPLLEEALGLLTRGEFLEGEEGTWCYGLRSRPEEMLRQCRRWLAQGYEAQDKYWQAGEQYRALCQAIPPDEDALHAWITMLARQGKMQDALRCYQEIKALWEAQGWNISPAIEQMVAALDRPPLQIPTLYSPFVQSIFLPTPGTMIPKGLSNPMDQLRRQFLQEAAGMLLPLFFGTRSKSMPALDEVVSHGSNIITACWHLMKGKEINTAEELLNAYTPTLLHLAFQASPYQQTIALIATQACMMWAIIAKHRLNPIAREMYCHEAIQCSRLSGDKAIRAGALMYLGYTYTFCHPLRPQKAIETFLEALRELEDRDDLVKSDICIGLADAYALVNDELQAKCTMQMAQHCFPSRPEQSASFLYADCALDTLYQWEAKMYLDLAQHNQRQDYYKSARNVLEQSTRVHAVSERCMIETIIYQTSAALGLRDLDAYTSCLEVGASTALRMGSQRRYREALDLYQQAPKAWKQEPKIQNLAAFFQESSRQEKQA